MPGKLTIRPLAAKLTRDTELFGQMDPYCKIVLGKQKIEGSVCYNGGKHPHWEDTLVLRRINEPECCIELKEKDWLLPDGTIGSCKLNLREVESQQRILKWFPITYKTKPAGQILIEASYEPDHSIPLSNQAQNAIINNQVHQPISTIQVPRDDSKIRGDHYQEKTQTVASGYGGQIHGWSPFNNQNQQSQIQVQGLVPVEAQINQQYSLQEEQRIPENYWAPSINAENNQPYKYPLFSPQEYKKVEENLYENPIPRNQEKIYQIENKEYTHNLNIPKPSDSTTIQNNNYQDHLYTNEVLPQHSTREEKSNYDPLQVIRGVWYKGNQ